MIEHHFTDQNNIVNDELARYERLWTVVSKGIRDRPEDLLGRQTNKALGAAAMSIVAAEDHALTLRYLRILRSLGLANFQFGVMIGESFELTLDGESFSLTGQPTSAFMNTDMWLTALFAAVIARDMAAIEILCQVPEPTHLNANLKPDHFDLAFVRAMKGLFQPEVNIGQLLVDAMEASDPETIDQDRQDYASLILLPQLPLYRCILVNDEVEFNEKLANALLRHKEFWGTNDKLYNPEGWIALPLIAAGALAFDNKGIEITTENEYIPSWLVRREFELA